MKKFYYRFSFHFRTSIIYLFMWFLLFLSGCGLKGEAISKTGFYFDTAVSLTVYEKRHEPLLEEAFTLCEFYEGLLSPTIEGSDVWNINHAGGETVLVDEKTAFLLEQAIAYAKLTEGLLDPTVAPLARLWNFTGNPPGPVPDEVAVRSLLAHVDYTRLSVDGRMVTLSDAEASVDLGFIAKGFIADELKAFFLERGVSCALINLGGNVLAVGSKPDHTPFHVGIRRPFADISESAAVVDLSDRSLVTSGNYERYFIQDEKLYHHILDTQTGWPSDSGLSSVTILSDTSLEGDALSTACFLLGETKGMALIDSLPQVEAFFIRQDGSIRKTEGFPD